MVFHKEMYYNIESVRMHAYYIHKRYVCLPDMDFTYIVPEGFYNSIKDPLRTSVLNEQIALFANLVPATFLNGARACP